VSQKMIPREKLTCQNRGEGGVGEEKIHLHTAIVCLAKAVHRIDGSSDWCGFGCFGYQLPIKVT